MSHERLAAAILSQAIKDTRRGSGEARRWLAGPDSRWLFDLVADEHDPEVLQRLALREAGR